MASHEQLGSWKKGTAALVVAVGTVVALLILLPAYRIFFAISVAIAIIVAIGRVPHPACRWPGGSFSFSIR